MRLSLTLVFFTVLFVVFGQKTSVKSIENIAINYKLNLTGSTKSNNSDIGIKEIIPVLSEDNIDTLLFIINYTNNNGFILLSADKNATPVLGYSDSTNYSQTNCTPALNFLINNYAQQINQISSGYTNKSAQEKWTDFENNIFPPKTRGSVSPLLTTTWDQDDGYNELCPPYNKTNCLVGCVALALGQVLNYHKYPAKGTGSHSYTHSTYGEIYADFESANYDWDNMNILNTENINNISNFLFNCGVSVDMNYGGSGSYASIYDIPYALKNYFNYKSEPIYLKKENYSDSIWTEMLKSELDNNRLVIYSGKLETGNGHAFVLDGYNDDNMFHINFGWNGVCDGYYSLDSIIPAFNYSYSQSAVFYIDSDTQISFDTTNIINIQDLSSYSGTTVNGVDNIHLYTTSSSSFNNKPKNGKEIIHTFTMDSVGIFEVCLPLEYNDKFDLILLNALSSDSIVAYGDYSIYERELPAGTYYLIVEGINRAEGEYFLNLSYYNAMPNISTRYLTVSEQENLKINQEISITFSFYNYYLETEENCLIGLYLSTDSEYDEDDIIITEENFSIIPDTSYIDTLQINYSIPDISTGQYWIVGSIDPLNNLCTKHDLYQGIYITEADSLEICNQATDFILYNYTKSDYIKPQDSTTSYINTYPVDETLSFTGPEKIYTIDYPDDGFANITFENTYTQTCYNLNYTILILSDCITREIITYKQGTADSSLIELSFPVKEDSIYYIVVELDMQRSDSVCSSSELSSYLRYKLTSQFSKKCIVPEIQISQQCEYTKLFVSSYYYNYQWLKDDTIITDATMSYYKATTPGSYALRISLAQCTLQTEPVTVEILETLPTPTISIEGYEHFCKDSTLILRTETDTSYEIKWRKDNSTITDATDTFLIIDEPGEYDLRLYDGSCYSEESVDISQLATPFDYSISTDKLLCFYTMNSTAQLQKDTINEYNSWSSPTATVADRHGNETGAKYLNGEDDFFTPSTDNSIGDEFTVSIWIQTTTNYGGSIISYGRSNLLYRNTTNTILLYLSDDGRIHYLLEDSITNTLSSTDSYNDGNWHMITASLSAEGAKLYIDAELITRNESVTTLESTSRKWHCASSVSDDIPDCPTNQYFEGAIDELAIYKKELPLEEIKALYNYGYISSNVSDNLICSGEDALIELPHSQALVNYQLISDSGNIGTSVSGNGDAITLTAEDLQKDTCIYLLAEHSVSGCKYTFDKAVCFNVIDEFTPSLQIISDKEDNTIYENQTIVFTIEHDSMPGEITYEWYKNDSLQQEQSADLEAAVPDQDYFYAVLHTTASCATIDSAVSNIITVTVLEGKIKQELYLNEGWNLISLCVSPDSTEIESIFPHVVIIKNDEGFYKINQLSYLNSISSIQGGKAYLLFNNVEENIEITGSELDEGYISSFKQGWNMLGIPYMNNYSLEILPAETEIIKNFEAFYILGEDFNSLDTLEVGKGYFIKVSNDSQISW